MAALHDIDDDINIVCRKPCVKYYRRDSAPHQNINCSKHLESDIPCFAPGSEDHYVYDRFGTRWKEYVRLILERFFERGLNDKHGIFKIMVRILFPTSTGEIDSSFTNNDDFKKCEDTICGYRIKMPGGYNDLSHISLHSMKPKYVQGTTPRIFGCAGYKLSDLHQGAFHYKIDVNSSLEEIAVSKPFKQLHAHPPGVFYPSLVPFNISKRDVNNELNYAILHGYIYNRFINYWNRCIDYIIVNPQNNPDSPDSPWSTKKKVNDGRNDLASIKDDFRKAIRIESPLGNSASREELLSLNDFTREIIELIEIKQNEESSAALSAASSAAASNPPKLAAPAAAAPHAAAKKGKLILSSSIKIHHTPEQLASISAKAKAEANAKAETNAKAKAIANAKAATAALIAREKAASKAKADAKANKLAAITGVSSRATRKSSAAASAASRSGNNTENLLYAMPKKGGRTRKRRVHHRLTRKRRVYRQRTHKK